HLFTHLYRRAPLALGLARPLAGSVHAPLGTKAGYGRGEVEIVDGSVLDHHGVADRIHACGHGPDDVLPVARVHIVVDDDDKLGVHELAQEGPRAHHDALGVAGVLLAHADHGEAIGTAFGRQIEIDDFRILLLDQR